MSMKAQDFSKYKDENELFIELMTQQKVRTKKEFQKWLQKNVPLETKYQSDIMDFLRKLIKKGVLSGGYVHKVTQGEFSSGGFPDLLLMYNTHTYYFEVKRPFLGKPSELQKICHESIRASGNRIAIVSYVEEVKQALIDWGVL